jgi:hypothetical protein
MTLSANTISRSAGFSVSVTVRNTGAMDAQEVVQVYATDLASSAVTPNTVLVGFTKVLIPYVLVVCLVICVKLTSTQGGKERARERARPQRAAEDLERARKVGGRAWPVPDPRWDKHRHVRERDAHSAVDSGRCTCKKS